MIRRLSALVLGAVLAIAGTADAGRPSRPWDAARWQIGGADVVGRIIPDDAPAAPSYPTWALAAGVTPTAVWAPVGAASAPVALVDLAGGRVATVVGSVAWSASTGWNFAGGGRINTGIAHVAATTWIARFAAIPNDDVNHAPLGSEDGTFRLHAYRGSNPHRYYLRGGSSALLSGRMLEGTMGMSGQVGYANGVADGSAATGSVAGNIVIGAGASTHSPLGGRVSSVWYYAGLLSAAQMAAQMAAMP